MTVLEVRDDEAGLRVKVQTRSPRPAGGSCGALAVMKDRVEVADGDLPCFGRPTILVWRKIRWRCPTTSCATGSFTDQAPQIASPRLAITDRAGDPTAR